ncbi:DUF4241 domain-containing protein [Microbacterium sp. ZW T5_56]|uniref:DUF4241 domain-containing protein n=1 Tax=Microbacterium sp. ZW T5_56 TaxID=3378081 RepID=UPI003853E4E6
MADTNVCASPEERVQKFMAEYEAQWRIAAPEFEIRDPEHPRRAFVVWGELMAATRHNHFSETSSLDLAGSFGRPAEYGPEAEEFVRVDVHGDTAYVITQTTSVVKSLHEYALQREGSDWRIVAIADHYGEPTAPFVDRVTIESNLATSKPDAPFTDVPPEQRLLDEVRNFTERDVARPDDQHTIRAEVSSVGTLTTSSGALAVIDFGYDNDDARPLARRVAPGSYPIERVTAFGRNAAVRVRFSDHEPVAWHPASLPESGHVIGVDAGCVCIVDYAAYASMSRRDKAAADGTYLAAARPAAMTFGLPTGDVGVVVDSGYGDGSYPVYWGVDAQGDIAQLVVDFLVLVTADENGVLIAL